MCYHSLHFTLKDDYIVNNSNRIPLGNFILTILLTLFFMPYLIPKPVLADEIKLLPIDGEQNDQFGYSISMDGGHVAIGSVFDDDNGSDSGSAYVFSALTGENLAKLSPTDGSTSDRFGWSIAIDNGIVAVGAPMDDENGDQSGSAYLFDSTTGAQLQKLLPTDGIERAEFGFSIAISNGIVVVGARQDSRGGGSGSAYLFDASTGEQLFKLLPSNGIAGDEFGFSVAIDDDMVAVGARWHNRNGSGYLFDVNSGKQIQTFLPLFGQLNDEFGYSIAISNGVVAVGARSDNEQGDNSGSAYLFDASSGDQLHKILSDDGETGDEFGFSISIEDGVVAVGARSDNEQGDDSGSVCLYDVATGILTEKLLPSDGTEGDNFGISVSIDDRLIAIGAYLSDDNGDDSGSAYVINISNGTGKTINELTKLLAGDGVTDDWFGWAVDIDNGIAAIGAYREDELGPESGSAYLFSIPNGNEIRKIWPADGKEGIEFGRSIGISDNVVAIGAPHDDENGERSGSAYLFDASNGNELHKLTASDGFQSDLFGDSIAIDGDTVAVGARFHNNLEGAVYIYDVGSGIESLRLRPIDVSPFDLFGGAVSIDGNIVAVGATGDDDNGSNSGSAYLFNASTGEQLHKLLPSDGTADDSFGDSIAIHGGLVVVGSPEDDHLGSNSGAVYVFEVASGTQIRKIAPDDGAEGDWFGESVAIQDSLVAVGARLDDDNGASSGSAYVFNALNGALVAKLLPSDGAAFYSFGNDIAIDNDIVIVGSVWDFDNGPNSGSAYVFDLNAISECLKLIVGNLVGGQQATMLISGGTPNQRAVTVYGTKAGQTVVKNISGYCATFGIKGVNQDKVLGGLNRTFDANGELSFNQFIPNGATGIELFFQSAQRGTCPDECVSNVVIATVG